MYTIAKVPKHYNFGINKHSVELLRISKEMSVRNIVLLTQEHSVKFTSAMSPLVMKHQLSVFGM